MGKSATLLCLLPVCPANLQQKGQVCFICPLVRKVLFLHEKWKGLRRCQRDFMGVLLFRF
jgi:hypothetical protein